MWAEPRAFAFKFDEIESAVDNYPFLQLKFNVDPAAFDLSVNDATLVPEYIQVIWDLAAEIGGFFVNGSQSLLTREWTQAQAAGDFVWAGEDAAFNREINIEAAYGDFVFGNAEAVFDFPPADRGLSASDGPYAFAGETVFSIDAIAATGAYAFGGAGELFKTKTLAADTKDFVMAGDNVMLRGQGLVADTSPYAFSGAEATYLISRNFYPEIIPYNFVGNATLVAYESGNFIALEDGVSDVLTEESEALRTENRTSTYRMATTPFNSAYASFDPSFDLSFNGQQYYTLSGTATFTYEQFYPIFMTALTKAFTMSGSVVMGPNYLEAATKDFTQAGTATMAFTTLWDVTWTPDTFEFVWSGKTATLVKS
jgi:hypothetical protein